METLRQQMMALLKADEMSARDLSRCLGIQEKEVYTHLAHVERTAAAQGKTVTIRPSRCLNCEFLFKNRRRFSRPGRCPRCKSTHLQIPLFRIR
jgi:predicted Zn-ribbon and HTH transcriptional regulator